MVQQIAGRRVGHAEMHSQCPQAPVTGQPEGRMLVEHLPVEVDANVRFHVFRAVVEYLLDAMGLFNLIIFSYGRVKPRGYSWGHVTYRRFNIECYVGHHSFVTNINIIMPL